LFSKNLWLQGSEKMNCLFFFGLPIFIGMVGVQSRKMAQPIFRQGVDGTMRE